MDKTSEGVRDLNPHVPSVSLNTTSPAIFLLDSLIPIISWKALAF